MFTISRFKLGFLFAVLLMLVANTPVMAEDPVPMDFSGKVTKIDSAQKKISIVDASNKRLTLRSDEKTKFGGVGKLDDLKKDDSVSGKYRVTADGKYIATEVNRK